MALGTPIETDSQVRLRTRQGSRLYSPGVTNAEIWTANGEEPPCTMYNEEDGNVGEESAIKKSEKIFRVFSWYSAPAGRKASGPGKGGIVPVLLLMTERIVIFVIEGC